jgi:hypothetical protein
VCPYAPYFRESGLKMPMKRVFTGIAPEKYHEKGVFRDMPWKFP